MYSITPSDLTFLWDECQRCFYHKVVMGFKRPASAFPKIFNRIDKLMKNHFDGISTADFAPALPPGVIRYGERWVRSEPLTTPGRRVSVAIRGKFDAAIAFDDGGFGLVDYKTSEPKAEHISFYSRQLHAYAYALEHPQPGSLALSPIRHMGLLFMEPVEMVLADDNRLAYLGEVTWVECQRDDDGFMSFIDQVLSVLESPEAPPPAAGCGYCAWLDEAKERGVITG